MKILAIRGNNMASLEGHFCADFTVEPLLSCGIFAITGPTGSGKSTVLDTMCLALYARTPRSEQAKESNVRIRDVENELLTQNDPRFLLRRGTAGGFAEVDFIAVNGLRYRSRWSVARARDKESGRLQGYRMSLFNLDKNLEEQGTRTEILNKICELTELTFEQFTRSVLLAQNDFSTFLKAEQSEKAALLEKLTGTGLYSQISRMIYEKTLLAKTAFEGIANQLKGIDIQSDEEEKIWKEALSRTEQKIKELEEKKRERDLLSETLRKLQTQIEEKQQLQNRTQEDIKQSINRLNQLKQENETLQKEQQDSREHHELLTPQIREAQKIDNHIEFCEKGLADARKAWETVEKEANQLKEYLQQVQKDSAIAQATLIHLKNWFEQYAEKESVVNQQPLLLMHLDMAETLLRTVKESEAQEQNWLSHQKNLEERKKEYQRVIEAQTKELETFSKGIELQQQKLSSLNKEKLQEEKAAKEKKREQLLLEQAQFVTTGDIKDLRDKLVEGQSCPVCGSKEHPYSSPEMDKKLLSLVREINQITQQIQAIQGELQNCEKIQTELQRSHQQMLQLEKEQTVQQTTLTEISNEWSLYREKISHERTNRTRAQETLEKSIREADHIFGNPQWQDKWQLSPESFRLRLIQFSQQWEQKKQEQKKQEQEEIERKIYLDTALEKEKAIATRLMEAEKGYVQSLATIKGLREKRSGFFEGKKVEEIEREYQDKQETIRKKLSGIQLLYTEQSGLVEKNRGIALQIEKDLLQHQSDLQMQTQVLDKWTQVYREEYGDQSLEELLGTVRTQYAEYNYKWRSQIENKEKAAGLLRQLEQYKKVYESWSKLNELAGSADGGKFRRIAQGYTLDLLLTYANQQLINLTSRYCLQRVPETLALQIIDRDMCDEVRTVHSLSGGESFLVSLALALGLSSLSSNRMKVESLFIDEGFGSLDAETLRIAMDALENLRTQGRKIGVISHVPEMTERIPVQIKISRVMNGKSKLEIL